MNVDVREIVVPRRIDDDEVAFVIEGLRRMSGLFGVLQEAAGTVWWTEGHRLRASIARRDEVTTIRVEEHDTARAAIGLLIGVMGVPAGVVLAAIAHLNGYGGPLVQAVIVATTLAASAGAFVGGYRGVRARRRVALARWEDDVRRRVDVMAPSTKAIGTGAGTTFAVPALSENAVTRR